MELAIAARVSELFGGTARLDAVENRSTDSEEFTVQVGEAYAARDQIAPASAIGKIDRMFAQHRVDGCEDREA